MATWKICAPSIVSSGSRALVKYQKRIKILTNFLPEKETKEDILSREGFCSVHFWSTVSWINEGMVNLPHYLLTYSTLSVFLHYPHLKDPPWFGLSLKIRQCLFSTEKVKGSSLTIILVAKPHICWRCVHDVIRISQKCSFIAQWEIGTLLLQFPEYLQDRGPLRLCTRWMLAACSTVMTITIHLTEHGHSNDIMICLTQFKEFTWKHNHVLVLTSLATRPSSSLNWHWDSSRDTCENA